MPAPMTRCTPRHQTSACSAPPLLTTNAVITSHGQCAPNNQRPATKARVSDTSIRSAMRSIIAAVGRAARGGASSASTDNQPRRSAIVKHAVTQTRASTATTAAHQRDDDPDDEPAAAAGAIKIAISGSPATEPSRAIGPRNLLDHTLALTASTNSASPRFGRWDTCDPTSVAPTDTSGSATSANIRALAVLPG